LAALPIFLITNIYQNPEKLAPLGSTLPIFKFKNLDMKTRKDKKDSDPWIIMTFKQYDKITKRLSKSHETVPLKQGPPRVKGVVNVMLGAKRV
jgi:hypothetical protein